MYNILHYIMGHHGTFIDMCNHNMFNGSMGCVYMQWKRPTIDGFQKALACRFQV